MNTDISAVRETLLARLETLDDKASILRAPELKQLFMAIREQPADQRAAYGQAVNAVKVELEQLVAASQPSADDRAPIDVTAPWDINSALPGLIPTTQGSQHPLTREIEKIADIFARMGFAVSESREIDDQYHMFETLKFQKGHTGGDD